MFGWILRNLFRFMIILAKIFVFIVATLMKIVQFGVNKASETEKSPKFQQYLVL
jgi:hypothetical protein